MATVLKTVVAARPPGVQIPLPPPLSKTTRRYIDPVPKDLVDGRSWQPTTALAEAEAGLAGEPADLLLRAVAGGVPHEELLDQGRSLGVPQSAYRTPRYASSSTIQVLALGPVPLHQQAFRAG